MSGLKKKVCVKASSLFCSCILHLVFVFLFFVLFVLFLFFFFFLFFSPFQKVLLMGKSGSGKTSMRSIIFANYIARDTMRLGVTIDVEHSHVRFLGNLVLNLWDCGGQEAFMENYFASQREHIFRNVEVLIYVFDIESKDHQKDLRHYRSSLEAIMENSKDAKGMPVVIFMVLLL